MVDEDTEVLPGLGQVLDVLRNAGKSHLVETVEGWSAELLKLREDKIVTTDAKAISKIIEATGVQPVGAWFLYHLHMAGGRVLTKLWISDNMPSMSKMADFNFNRVNQMVYKIRSLLGSDMIETIERRGSRLAGYRLSADALEMIDDILGEDDE
jgi:DNA-binding winged helix-turn-helix (wHTH) protein